MAKCQSFVVKHDYKMVAGKVLKFRDPITYGIYTIQQNPISTAKNHRELSKICDEKAGKNVVSKSNAQQVNGIEHGYC